MNDKKNREPMVIALATGKGGSMKTTSAVFLACALVDQSRGEQHVLVADADVQGDAKDWWYRAAELDDPLPFDVMSAAPAESTEPDAAPWLPDWAVKTLAELDGQDATAGGEATA